MDAETASGSGSSLTVLARLSQTETTPKRNICSQDRLYTGFAPVAIFYIPGSPGFDHLYIGFAPVSIFYITGSPGFDHLYTEFAPVSIFYIPGSPGFDHLYTGFTPVCL